MPPTNRLHHIDAIRAFAMLLGIVLHAALAYGGSPWIAVDDSKHDFFKWLMEVIHGFRMQLFFFVSGYFTMLLWRKRGLGRLLEQRFQRVIVPFLLGYFLIVPAMTWVTTWSVDHAPKSSSRPKAAKSELVEAIRKRDLPTVQSLVGTGTNPNQPDQEFNIPPLNWAAMYGEVEIVRTLLDGGADVNGKDKNGYRALHSAAFLGRPKVVKLLLERGADLDAIGSNSDTARETAQTDSTATFFIVTAIRISPIELANIESRRKECLTILDAYAAELGSSWLAPVRAKVKDWRNSYRDWYTSGQWNVKLNVTGPQVHLILSPQFAHLWFLWFLCGFVSLFAIGVLLVWYLPLPHWPGWFSYSRFRLLWLVPITLVPQLFMGGFGATLGPDTSIGVIPMPHLFAYYAVFFCVGAIYYDAKDDCGCLGGWWWLWLPLAGICFWQAKSMLGDTLISGFWQVLYTWAMIYGLLGLFHRLIRREWWLIRYLSDSAYWLYLMHLPIVVFLQAYLRDWPYPGWQKFLAICGITTGGLLIVYQLLVRPTYLGTILNGPRHAKQPAPTPVSEPPSPELPNHAGGSTG